MNLKKTRDSLKRDPKGTLNRLMEDGMDALSERFEVFREEHDEEPGPTMPAPAKPAQERPTRTVMAIDAFYVQTVNGEYHFLFDRNEGINAVDARAGMVSCSIPGGRDPLQFEYLAPVKITIEEKV